MRALAYGAADEHCSREREKLFHTADNLLIVATHENA